jgi:cofilin
MSKTLKYITFRLSDDKKEIVVDGKSDDSDYEKFLNQLPADGCRWAVYDFDYKLEDGSQRNKLCFFSW